MGGGPINNAASFIMKFKHINPKNVEHLIPSWAINPISLARELDDQLEVYWQSRVKKNWDSVLDFFVQVYLEEDGSKIRFAELDDKDDRFHAGTLTIESESWAIAVPLNDLFKECPDVEGLHCVYAHQFPDGVISQYIGVTKQRWFDRLAQHESSARNGSPYLFHRALRDRREEKITHKVFVAGVDYETAMNCEEEFVDLGGLYPKGLNMIPGGFAGMRYLHKLGFAARSAEERDQEIERIVSSESLSGKPNLLCAAKWSTDQSYINRVICGHSGRLTVDQVRMIRIMDASGKTVEEIAHHINDTPRRVRRVLKEKVYARVS